MSIKLNRSIKTLNLRSKAAEIGKLEKKPLFLSDSKNY